MFNIYDGREHFFQWDLNQKLIVLDDTINEVHFCNKTDECSLVVAVEEYEGERVANVPNVLLQDSWTIHAYAFAANYTKVEQCFKVVPRSKPADYLYTETEIATLEKMEQAIDRIEENIGEVARDYLTENKDELLTGFATETYVNDAVDDALAAKAFATETYVDEALEEYAAEALEGYATEEFVANATKDFATETYVDEAIAAIDIGGSTGASSWDELTGKPFYSEATEDVLFESSTIAIDDTPDGSSKTYYQTTFSGGEAVYKALSTTKEYFVKFEGNEYRCEAIKDSDGTYYLGNLFIESAAEADTKQPFLVKITRTKILTGGDATYTYTGYLIMPNKPVLGKNYSLSIYEVEDIENVKTIDERYIPDTVARTSDLTLYALKTELPDTSKYVTKTNLENKGYQTAAQVNALIDTALGVIENGAY